MGSGSVSGFGTDGNDGLGLDGLVDIVEHNLVRDRFPGRDVEVLQPAPDTPIEHAVNFYAFETADFFIIENISRKHFAHG
jgi:hypothetical protein